MTPEQFCYWLQGFTELNPGASPTPEQWRSITEHLGLVFRKVTPPLDIKDLLPHLPPQCPGVFGPPVPSAPRPIEIVC